MVEARTIDRFLIAHEEGVVHTEVEAFRPVGCICGSGGAGTGARGVLELEYSARCKCQPKFRERWPLPKDEPERAGPIGRVHRFYRRKGKNAMWPRAQCQRLRLLPDTYGALTEVPDGNRAPTLHVEHVAYFDIGVHPPPHTRSPGAARSRARDVSMVVASA